MNRISRTCPTCSSAGFGVSALGPDRCYFCDGTEGGNPPDDEALADSERLMCARPLRTNSILEKVVSDSRAEAITRLTAAVCAATGGALVTVSEADVRALLAAVRQRV